MVSVIDNVFEMIRLFTEVALGGVPGGSALLLLFGTVFVAFSLGVLGYLTLGAVVDLVVPSSTGGGPPERRQHR